jgi:ABC-type molybdate transport system substrate-binding protein
MGVLLAGPGLLGGCQRQATPPPEKVERDPNLLVVYGVCALEQMLESARQEFERESSGKSANLTILQPAEIVARIEGGDVPDLVVLVGEAELTQLEQGGFLDRGSRQSMGGLALAIAAPRGNPSGVRGPEDLARVRLGGISTALAGMTSLGTSAKRELERTGLWDSLQEKLTVTVTSFDTLRAVADGEAEAGILYDPCPRLLTGNEFPPEAVEFVSPLTASGANRVTRIHAEAHKRSPNALLAQRFLRLLMAQEVTSSAPATAEVPEDEAEASASADVSDRPD